MLARLPGRHAAQKAARSSRRKAKPHMKLHTEQADLYSKRHRHRCAGNRTESAFGAH